eukprot:TRINITY_DN8278_c0_g2_i1.p1 TRINITY_DN8278_c0_g2~~TRINITY_DN8278_c0_g2_i1.p1  ORF type:complete len:133 (+),score=1.01 TRINITY_DN8278_c0_g2_i1:85-483(+)
MLAHSNQLKPDEKLKSPPDEKLKSPPISFPQLNHRNPICKFRQNQRAKASSPICTMPSPIRETSSQRHGTLLDASGLEAIFDRLESHDVSAISDQSNLVTSSQLCSDRLPQFRLSSVVLVSTPRASTPSLIV